MTTLFGTDTVHDVPAINASATPKKRGWLPLLTILFMISYGLMTMLIVEQGRTIDSQRALIRELLRDSTELSAVKKAQADAAKTQAPVTQAPVTQNQSIQIPSTQYPSTQYPSTQYPSTQAPTNHAPSSQAPSAQGGSQQQRTQGQAARKPDFKLPSKPAPDLVDDPHVLITI